MRVYASAETHFSVSKAAAALGVGFAPVAVDRDRRPHPAALRTAIASDRAAACRRSASSPTPARHPPAPSTRSTRSPPSRPTRACGCTWTAPTERPRRRTRPPAISSPAWVAPTRCASTPTSGFTRRSIAARCCSTTRRPRRGRSAPAPTTTSGSSPANRRRPMPSGTTDSSSAAASARSSCGRRCAFTARAGSRPRRRGHPRRRPPRRARQRRGRLRAAHRPRAEHLLLPTRAADLDEAALGAHNERILQSASARRPRLPVERDDRRALRPARLHHELPHHAGRCRAGSHGRARAG